MKRVDIQVRLPESQAMALAQFLKRIGWDEMRVNAADEMETYEIRSALTQIQNTLEAEGYAPR